MTIARGALPLRGWTHETSPTGICSKAAFVWRVCVINVPLLRLNLEPSAERAELLVGDRLQRFVDRLLLGEALECFGRLVVGRLRAKINQLVKWEVSGVGL